MFNYYLSRIGFSNASSNQIENCLVLLNQLVIEDSKGEDSFLKNESIWDFETPEGSFGEVVFSKFNDIQFSSTVLPKLIESVKSIKEEFRTLDEFDNSSYKIYNAFYGACFHTDPNERHICNKTEYRNFRDKYLWELTPDTFWERRELLFSKVIFCPSVEFDIKLIGSTYLSQIKQKIVELDQYINLHWKSGEFSYKDANSSSALNISPESKKTMEQEKYYNQRLFSTPDGRRLCFELHIKTGNLRFHFYPENGKIYIGYIGKHLDTDKFN
ncbi:hypothetical protein [Reichenbachiella sp. MSK19-1]|uniref:hypothetical protein n=1 Tax=Reichenbachiella sp. MSK19-1 TaxID=1897631 RepID=UPI000E6C0B90|nr:hypothetical protein [Reichenbachiella sp. MSK19-1]RJE75225.1 hypothetical protein BGP76_19185 [Reichenbachiella sp. MSK19-1]